MKKELYVSLKIPDATALTALRTLHEMGFSSITDLKREEYYLFEGELGGEFEKEIVSADILVNANKHHAQFTPAFDGQRVLVMDTEQGEGLKNTLSRLGFEPITTVKRGVLWTFEGDGSQIAQTTEELLVNKHYQHYQLLTNE